MVTIQTIAVTVKIAHGIRLLKTQIMHFTRVNDHFETLKWPILE